jgi:hypothetical protein
MESAAPRIRGSGAETPLNSILDPTWKVSVSILNSATASKPWNRSGLDTFHTRIETEDGLDGAKKFTNLFCFIVILQTCVRTTKGANNKVYVASKICWQATFPNRTSFIITVLFSLTK